MNQPSAPIVIETQANPKYAVIWLHGLGSNGHDFEPIVPELILNDLAIRFIFPHAPSRPVTVNGGHVMPAWYDIKGSDIADKEDLQGIHQSQNYLNDLVNQTIADGILSEKIVIAGFSQGGAVATYSLIRMEHKLAGCLALSTYVPFINQSQNEIKQLNSDTPIFWGHGSLDDVVPESLGKKSVTHLIDLGYTVDWHSYPITHSVNADEIKDISHWFKKIFI